MLWRLWRPTLDGRWVMYEYACHSPTFSVPEASFSCARFGVKVHKNTRQQQAREIRRCRFSCEVDRVSQLFAAPRGTWLHARGSRVFLCTLTPKRAQEKLASGTENRGLSCHRQKTIRTRKLSLQHISLLFCAGPTARPPTPLATY